MVGWIVLYVFSFLDLGRMAAATPEINGEKLMVHDEDQPEMVQRDGVEEATADEQDPRQPRKLSSSLAASISSRRQWDCNFREESCCNAATCTSAICDGYCGEVALQESLLYYGAYVSQGLIRRTIAWNDFAGAREILIDTDRPGLKPDLLKTARLLGLDAEGWYARQLGTTGLRNFVNWTKTHLNQGCPVAMGVVFQGSREIAYDHIVTAVQSISHGLRFNDHYSRNTRVALTSSLPAPGEVCQQEYCFARYMNGVALKPPPSVAERRFLARLRVVSSGVRGEQWKEPNWTCRRAARTTLTLEVGPTNPELLPSNQTLLVAVTFRGTTAQEIRNGDLFGRPYVACHPLSDSAATVRIKVKSDAAIFTRIVVDASDCP